MDCMTVRGFTIARAEECKANAIVVFVEFDRRVCSLLVYAPTQLFVIRALNRLKFGGVSHASIEPSEVRRKTIIHCWT